MRVTNERYYVGQARERESTVPSKSGDLLPLVITPAIVLKETVNRPIFNIIHRTSAATLATQSRFGEAESPSSFKRHIENDRGHERGMSRPDFEFAWEIGRGSSKFQNNCCSNIARHRLVSFHHDEYIKSLFALCNISEVPPQFANNLRNLEFTLLINFVYDFLVVVKRAAKNYE